MLYCSGCGTSVAFGQVVCCVFCSGSGTAAAFCKVVCCVYEAEGVQPMVCRTSGSGSGIAAAL